MTLLSPLDDAPERSTAPRLSAPRAEDLPPLTITTHASVPALESTPVRLLDETAVREAVGRFAAATLLPLTTAEATREQVRANWAAAVNLVEVSSHPDWMLAYIPGAHVGDAMVHAIHLSTGHVFGGDTGATVQQRGESTHTWLDRLTAEFETHAADYSLSYIAHGDHA